MQKRCSTTGVPLRNVKEYILSQYPFSTHPLSRTSSASPKGYSQLTQLSAIAKDNQLVSYRHSRYVASTPTNSDCPPLKFMAIAIVSSIDQPCRNTRCPFYRPFVSSNNGRSLLYITPSYILPIKETVTEDHPTITIVCLQNAFNCRFHSFNCGGR